MYGPDELERLRFIQRLKALGLSLAEIKELNAVYAIGGYAKKPAAVGSGANTQEHQLRESAVYAVASPVIEVLNPYVSDTWTRKQNMHCARVFAAAAVLPYDQQGVIFVTGGRNSTSPCKY